jgi:hypothetical protein
MSSQALGSRQRRGRHRQDYPHRVLHLGATSPWVTVVEDLVTVVVFGVVGFAHRQGADTSSKMDDTFRQVLSLRSERRPSRKWWAIAHG